MVRLVAAAPLASQGLTFASSWQDRALYPPRWPARRESNPLREFFDARRQGRGIWKWLHYFDIYHRHLAPFVGRPVHVLEIGIYSGGSLEMWSHYFGSGCQIIGVDIEAACKAYESKRVQVLIGDQADRDFWARVRDTVPVIDIVIDDGGHRTEQQIVSLEELLPHVQPGGVYICEDVHGVDSAFIDYMHGLVKTLHAFTREYDGTTIQSPRTPFQAAIRGIHFYPYAVVVERDRADIDAILRCPKHGTEWQPFL